MSQHQQPRKKRARKVAMVGETMPVGTAWDGPVGDQQGHLAVGLAIAVVAIVAVAVLMAILAAT